MSSWQDWVLATSFLVFNLALLPSVLSKRSKPALGTSAITTLFMVPNVIVYLSLSLWYAALMNTINLCLWATLAIQVLARPKAAKR